MNETFNNLSNNERRFLKVLLDEGVDKSDASIARKMSVSPATVFRLRKKLEDTVISDYVPIIQLEDIGIEVFAVLNFSWKAFHDDKKTEDFFQSLEDDPHVVFLANGEGGSDFTSVAFLAFRNLKEFYDYMLDFRKKNKEASNISTIILPSSKVRKTDFTHIIRHLLEGEKI